MSDLGESLGVSALGQLHIIVDDIDAASEFYRNVMGFLEMQSHHISGNAGLSAYYGISGSEYDGFEVSLRFLTWPGVLTLKLVKIHDATVKSREGKIYQYLAGLGPVSIETEDLDRTFNILQKKARDYSGQWSIKLLSEPVYLSPLKPHEIGATKNSILHGNSEVLDEIERAFPERAKFQMIDPFGVSWEFNNSMS